MYIRFVLYNWYWDHLGREKESCTKWYSMSIQNCEVSQLESNCKTKTEEWLRVIQNLNYKNRIKILFKFLIMISI